MSRSGLGRESRLRIPLAVVVAVDQLSFFFFLKEARQSALDRAMPIDSFAAFVSTPLVAATIVLIGMAATIAFARRPGRLVAGIISLCTLAVLSRAHAQLFGSPWRHLYYSGLCLAGWLVGAAVDRRKQTPYDESYARLGGTALLGAAYLNAGISKLVYGGLEWLSGLPIQTVIIGQDGLAGDGVLAVYRAWVATTPLVACLFSIATFGFEAGAPLMILGGRTRRCVAAGLIAMHTNIYLLTPILYLQSMLLLALFGLSPERGDPEAAEVPNLAILSRDRLFYPTAALLALCAAIGIGHQGLRYARQQGPPPALAPPAAAPPVSQGP